MASSAPAFKVLKDLVSTWDKVVNFDSRSNVAIVARGLLDHVHRWTRSESSILYDPALARFLAWLVRKVFRQLNSKLRNRAHVIYASMSRMILATTETLFIIPGARSLLPQMSPCQERSHVHSLLMFGRSVRGDDEERCILQQALRFTKCCKVPQV